MNRLGMVVDLSHSGKKTCLDAINFSSKPVAISHANPLFFHNSVRNIDDERAPTADRYYGYYADAHQDYGRNYYIDFTLKMK